LAKAECETRPKPANISEALRVRSFMWFSEILRHATIKN